MCAESSQSGEVERRLAESERIHTSQLSLLQQQLQLETEKREMAERLVKEVRSEVAIGMEDVTPSLPSSLPGEEKTLVNYVNMAVTWGQRLVRNPNIVLTRLLRTTPQTKLFFLAYFILLHIILLFILIL
ncbi:hypothetical protein GBAR_LOCUS3345 [Geodia barretti]|uniref:Golgin-84 n=1 Tax=Geodia barretti TaxID=519541 RepID=A0AA35R2Z4_GEOBA|nr:hypothetical protein GBAR_LOCUS3345 [Geodia barretti]